MKHGNGMVIFLSTEQSFSGTGMILGVEWNPTGIK
jgi:hypothetical protein